MKYPYFRGLEADRYSFYRVPKALIKVDLFEKMSGDAKLLYAVLLDRMNLSLKNGWQDENGNAYIICTIDEIMDSIRCARQKAVKLLDELEHEYQLIERRRQGLGKPNLLYVKAKKKKEHHLTVQRSIPYLEMGRDGICRVEEHLYSKTVRFYDINYQLAQNEDKNTIFESWCDFLNYFDSSIRFQLSFINHKSDMSEYNKVIQIEPQHDQFDDVRMEYAQMLKQQLAKGNNGLVRTKYITFSIEAKSVKEAKPRLERIETDILNNFKVLGVKAYPLNGVERLQIMYEMFHQEEERKFEFSYDRILQSGMTTKDFIAPTSFLFKSGKDFQMGDTIGAVSYLNILAPELTDKVLAEFLDMDKNLVVSIHVQSVDQLKAIKLIKGKITDLDRMKIEEVRPDRALCSVA